MLAYYSKNFEVLKLKKRGLDAIYINCFIFKVLL